METATLQFNGGMNTDLDKSMRDGSTYLRAENFTFTSKDGGNMGAEENVVGNKEVTTVSIASGHIIVGYINIVDMTLYFTTNGTVSNIYLEDGDTFTTLYSDTSSTTKLNFSTDPKYRIVGVGNSETSKVAKAYWVDGLNEVRHINIYKDYSGLDAAIFDFTPNNDLSGNIDTEVVKGGGLYKAGVVYHAFQLYNKNGSSSTLSNISTPVKLSEYASLKDGGTDKGEDSGCGVDVSITNLSSNMGALYDRIRVYAIYYDSQTNPVINVVSEREIKNGSTNILDNGNYIDEITMSEFLSLKQTDYIPKAISSKDNRLFVGNIKEASFTHPILDDHTDPNYWDSRAYRFPETSGGAFLQDVTKAYHTSIYNSTGAHPYKIVGTSSTIPGVSDGDDVPYDFDCINPYNEIYSVSSSARVNQTRTGDNTTIGGEGLNLRYTFTTVSKSIDKYGALESTDTEAVVSNKTDEFTTNGVDSYKMVECESGEVYRVGIRFFNSKGQSSFVKWIGDILTPEEFYQGKVWSEVQTWEEGIVNFAQLLKVELKNTADLIAAGVTSWQIVRVNRTELDRSVLANGLIEPLWKDTSSYHRPIVNDNYMVAPISYYKDSVGGTYTNGEYSPNEFKFISPNTTFNDPGSLTLTGHKLRVYNYYNTSGHQNRTTTTAGILDNETKIANRKVNKLEYLTDGDTNLYEITDSIYIEPMYANVSTSFAKPIGAISLFNQTLYNRATNFSAPSCSSQVVSIGNSTLISNLSSTDGYFYGSIIANKDESRYGGLSYFSRLDNEYIPFSDITPITTTTNYCVHGDTYTNMYYYMNNMVDDSKQSSIDRGFQCVNMIPVQSTIDLRYRQDRILDYYSGPRDFAIGKDNMVQEKVEKGIELYDTKYNTAIGDLYKYNTAYSSQNTASISYPKPFDFDNEETINTKIMASELKVNGENEDNWTRILPANFIEVDGSYGEVHNLETHSGNLFFWQAKGFGRLAVNDRSLITDSSGAQLSLGSGAVLERFDYISTEIGNVDKYNITKSETDLFWSYSPRNLLYKYNGQLEEISTSKGVSKYISDKGTIVNPISICDFINKETLFRVNGEVLVYDWLSASFTGVYTFNPNWLFTNYDGTYGSSENAISVWQHGTGARGSFYGTVYDSTIKHISSDNYPITKVYDNLSWDSTSVVEVTIPDEDTLTCTDDFDLAVSRFAIFEIVPTATVANKHLKLHCDFKSPVPDFTGFDRVYFYYYEYGDVSNQGITTRISTLPTSSYQTYELEPSAYATNTTWDCRSLRVGLWSNGTNGECEVGAEFVVKNIKLYDTNDVEIPYFIRAVNGGSGGNTYATTLNTYTGLADGTNVFEDTFYSIRAYNDYQNSHWKPISLASKTLSRKKERSFTTSVPRDIVNAPQSSNVNIFDSNNLDATQLHKRRIRDKYVILDFKYNNSNNYKFSIPYINVWYRGSAR